MGYENCRHVQKEARQASHRNQELIEGEEYERVLLRWVQARGDNTKKKSGNRAIIEELSKEEIVTVPATALLKEQMLNGTDNPFTTVFIVDVQVGSSSGKRIYRVLKVYEDETFELES